MSEYQLKRTPEDFCVKEVLHLHCIPYNKENCQYYILEKIGLTTFQAIEMLAEYFSLPSKEIGYAGLKDEDAVTIQYLSLPSLLAEDMVKQFNEQYSRMTLPFISLTYYGCGAKPLKVAKLHGNCFTLRIRNITLAMMQQIQLKEEYFFYFLNYYGSQRFGLPNQIKNTHLIGKAIYAGDFTTAKFELSRQLSPVGLLAKTTTAEPVHFIASLDARLVAFYQSAYYSHLWNESLINQLSTNNISLKKHTIEGIDYYFPSSQLEALRFMSNVSELDNTRVTTDGTSFTKTELKRSTVVQTKIYIDEIIPDQLNLGKYAISLSFYLTSGSYATMAITQFFEQILNTNSELTLITQP